MNPRRRWSSGRDIFYLQPWFAGALSMSMIRSLMNFFGPAKTLLPLSSAGTPSTPANHQALARSPSLCVPCIIEISSSLSVFSRNSWIASKTAEKVSTTAFTRYVMSIQRDKNGHFYQYHTSDGVLYEQRAAMVG